jgi:hypothetical protein
VKQICIHKFLYWRWYLLPQYEQSRALFRWAIHLQLKPNTVKLSCSDYLYFPNEGVIWYSTTVQVYEWGQLIICKLHLLQDTSQISLSSNYQSLRVLGIFTHKWQGVIIIKVLTKHLSSKYQKFKSTDILLQVHNSELGSLSFILI